MKDKSNFSIELELSEPHYGVPGEEYDQVRRDITLSRKHLGMIGLRGDSLPWVQIIVKEEEAGLGFGAHEFPTMSEAVEVIYSQPASRKLAIDFLNSFLLKDAN